MSKNQIDRLQYIDELHSKAMTHVELAAVYQAKGNEKRAEKENAIALTWETEAANLIASLVTLEPSRSIILRSAAAIAVDCGEFREAERFIATALSGHPGQEMEDDLRDFFEVVNLKRHLSLRGLVLDNNELQLSIAGGDSVGFGVMESKQFLLRAEAIERLLSRTVSRKLGLEFSESATSNKDFPIYYSMPRAASFAVTVRIGRPLIQLHLDFEGKGTRLTAKDVIQDVVSGLSEFSEGKVKELETRIDDEAYFNNFTGLAKKLAPDGTKVKTVGLTSVDNGLESKIALERPNRSIWSKPKANSHEVVISGWLRSADERVGKKSHSIIIEDDSAKSTRVYVKPGMLNDIVRPYWGDKIQVTVLSTKNRLELIDLAPFDDVGQ